MWIEEMVSLGWMKVLGEMETVDELVQAAREIRSKGEWTDVLDAYARQLAERLS